MSANGDSHSHGNHDVRFEETDIVARPIVLAVIALAAFALIFTGIAHLYFDYLAAKHDRSAVADSWHLGDFGKAAQKASAESAASVPAPRLQVEPKTDLEILREQEAKSLGSWGWVDKQAGIAQVPIEKAKQMLLAKGLPSREGSVVPPKMAPHAYAAPSQGYEGSGAPDWFGGAGLNHEEAAHGEGGHAAGHADGGHAQGGHAAPEAHGH